MTSTYIGLNFDLQEPRDGLLVVGSHGHYVLIEPEERPVAVQPHIGQDAEEFKEQSPSTLCTVEDNGYNGHTGSKG